MKRLKKGRAVDKEDWEDVALLNAMNEVDRSKFVSRKAVMQKLRTRKSKSSRYNKSWFRK